MTKVFSGVILCVPYFFYPPLSSGASPAKCAMRVLNGTIAGVAYLCYPPSPCGVSPSKCVTRVLLVYVIRLCLVVSHQPSVLQGC